MSGISPATGPKETALWTTELSTLRVTVSTSRRDAQGGFGEEPRHPRASARLRGTAATSEPAECRASQPHAQANCPRVVRIARRTRRELGTNWASLVAQRLKHLPPMRETRVRSLGQEDPPEKDEALFRCARPSGVPRGPATSTGSLASQRHPGTISFSRGSSRPRDQTRVSRIGGRRFNL